MFVLTDGRPPEATPTATLFPSTTVCLSAGGRPGPTLTVANEAGRFARVAGMFTARGYNSESLAVADITADHKISRITIVTDGPPRVIDQIIETLERLVPVHRVTDLTENGPYVARELTLGKFTGHGDTRIGEVRRYELYGNRQ